MQLPNETQVDKWFRLFSRTLPMANSLTPSHDLLNVWHAAFDKLNPQQFETVCTEAITQCKFFPSPGEITERIAQKFEKIVNLAAADDWTRANILAESWDPAAGGFMNKISTLRYGKLSEEARYAIRQVGGLPAIRNCAQDQMDWMRKRFLKAYSEGEERQRLGIGEGQATRLLSEIRTQTKLLEAGNVIA